MIYFIVNPASGAGKAQAAAKICDSIMHNSGLEYTMLHTQKPADFERIYGLINFDTATAIACVGGDGTVQEYLQLAINRNINFGIIPAGSGNDAMYSLPNTTAPKFRSFEEKTTYYTNRIIHGETIEVDAITVNGKYYFNIGGAGIDINVVRDATRLKKILGGAAYFAALVKNIVTYKAEKITITIDGIEETNEFLLLAICNGAYYGGGLNIAPPAKMNDGLITVCKITKLSRLKMLALFPSVKPGRHTGIKGVSFINCTSLQLDFHGTKTINLDGNLIDMNAPLRFKILKNSIKIII